jgi:activator of 2-hydroxyglutaryl-CoA dehydratase
MIGGVIAHHPYLKVLLNEKFDKDIQIIEAPQFIVSYGAAIIASQHYQKTIQTEENTKLATKES